MKKCFLLPCIIILIFVSAQSLFAQIENKDIAGTWQGTLKVSSVQLRIVFKADLTDEGSLRAAMDSPDQGAFGIPVDRVYIDGGKVIFDVSSIGGKYEGSFTEQGTIEGKWMQSGSEFPLNLERTENEIKINRPQHPEPPFPYNSEEVTFINEDEGITLAGTFTYPKDGDSFPAVVLISGSGPQDRDETVFNHKPFLVLSDQLTRSGIAVLRFDDRGVGQSTGNFAAATSEDFMRDVIAGVKYLKTRSEVDINNIGLIGHSEGAMISPMAAINSSSISYLVLLAGPGVSGKEILFMQTKAIGEVNGESPETIQRDINFMKSIYEDIIGSKDSVTTVMKIRKKFYTFYSELSDEEKKQVGDPETYFKNQINIIMSPWFRYFLAFDPADYLKQITIPVLAITGSNDLQVPADVNLNGIRKALEEAGNNNFTIKKLNDLNHLFQRSETGAISEYALIEETFSPEALQIITDWILETTGRDN